MECFSNFMYVASASTYDEGLNLILEFQPDFVFLEINPQVKSSQLSLLLINELHRYLNKIPKIIAISENTAVAYEALKYDVADFLIKPITEVDLRKTFLRIEKQESNNKNSSVNPIIEEPISPFKSEIGQTSPEKKSFSQVNFSEELLIILKNEITGLKETLLDLLSKPNDSIDKKEVTDLIVQAITENASLFNEIDFSSSEKKSNSVHEEPRRKLICIKSYGDYRFLELDDLAFLQADNNSTDITLNTGEQITAFKTLKYFEENLPSNFYRIHNSYIVNKNYISRIHTGNSLCYIKNTKNQIPFSKSYKDNIDSILTILAGSEHKES